MFYFFCLLQNIGGGTGSGLGTIKGGVSAMFVGLGPLVVSSAV
jgi:hypothetical protein